jgi:hypothetical protein
MMLEELFPLNPRMKEAIEEMKAVILGRYPGTTFTLYEGEEPQGIYLIATVDREDMGEVADLFIDREVELQVEENLPLFVIPVPTAERNAAVLARQGRSRTLTAS